MTCAVEMPGHQHGGGTCRKRCFAEMPLLTALASYLGCTVSSNAYLAPELKYFFLSFLPPIKEILVGLLYLSHQGNLHDTNTTLTARLASHNNQMS